MPVPLCIAPNRQAVVGWFKNTIKVEVARYCFFLAHCDLPSCDHIKRNCGSVVLFEWLWMGPLGWLRNLTSLPSIGEDEEKGLVPEPPPRVPRSARNNIGCFPQELRSVLAEVIIVHRTSCRQG